ncbi:MAG: TetR/AcrR family transcriptional regulator [Leptospira sp.]|nr:TetR/AcrR family transcriptional regulator [Leptospira sp.]
MRHLNLEESGRFLSLPLKERKFAKTRLNVIEVFLEQLESRSFEEIKIKDIYLKAQISEPTFYNYFPEKEDMVLLFIQIWSLQVSVFASQNKSTDSGYKLLSSLFRYTANESKKNPRILLEIISFQAKKIQTIKIPKLTLSERLLLFPHQDGIQNLPAMGIEGLIKQALDSAEKRGELPSSTNWQNFGLAIAALFFGVPVIAFQTDQGLEKLWLESLSYLWLGAGGKKNKE